jgi:membrane-bound serine protease (ClpP class)
MRTMISLILLGLLFQPASADAPAAPATPPGTVSHAAAAGHAALVLLTGAIGPATSSYVTRALNDSEHDGATVVILEVDTPGGLDTAMRDIIKAILASPVPVVSYVAPGGARAASAGTYILYASHVAAMAPGTNLGAATPVAVGGEGGAAPESAPQPAPPQASPQPTPQLTPRPTMKPGTSIPPPKESSPTAAPVSAPMSTLERKSVNDAVAYIRSLAALRGRNADWAEDAVRNASSLSADEARDRHVIELIASDVPDLLRRLDGRSIRIGEHDVTLRTAGLAVNRIEPDWRVQLLATLTHPTIAYGLLLIGIYGLLLEGYNPGAVLPGVAGAIALLVALYAFQLLSVNYAGLGLMALGIGLIAAEHFVAAFGSLVIGGLVAFVIGSLMLFDSGVPGLGVAHSVIAGVSLAGGLLAATIVLLATRARRRAVSTGTEAMIGALVEAAADIGERGVVRYEGELWNARTPVPLRAGQSARIVRVDGLTLWVEPADRGPNTSTPPRETS